MSTQTDKPDKVDPAILSLTEAELIRAGHLNPKTPSKETITPGPMPPPQGDGREVITLPYNFTPRPYQVPFYNCLSKGFDRGVAVWHRRAGKDKCVINLMTSQAFSRVGIYYYFLPSYNQGRKIVWDGIDRDGFAFLDHIPDRLAVSKNATEMKVKLTNGSLFQVVGSDNIDTIVGTNPVGCIFSEYSLQDPRGWDFIRPILRENGGWALFIYTPRGHNHGWDLYKMARGNPKWFCEKLTIKETGVLSEHDMEEERLSGMGEDLIEQEYYCSFEAAIPGAYYSNELRRAKDQKRLTKVPYDEGVAVDTYWDLGMGDSTAIWFAQNVGREVHLIDYHEASGEGLKYYAEMLQRKAYLYGRHVAPHDIEVRELGTGKSRREMAYDLGIDFEVAPKLRIPDGIMAARRMLSMCWVDEIKCERGIDALYNYRKDYDPKLQTYRTTPVHDWASHGADAFRTLATGHEFYDQTPPDWIHEPPVRDWMAM